ncbi:hypothetical protein PDIDSM_594 [Penicillium digitatum]|nr:hypothetical protein PDIDSM_594 [Penicillium digitatum]
MFNVSDGRHSFFRDKSSDKRPLASTEKNQSSNGDYQVVELSQDQLLVEFQENSSRNPPNWAFMKKVYNAVIALLIVLNSGISSALPSNAVPAIMQDFHESGDQQKVLPTAVFLIGYVVGPLLFSPLSETIGRKPVLVWSFSVFVLATLGCALSPNWSSLLIFRTICGLAGAAPQTVVGGIYADLFFDLRSRGRAMAMYMSACSFGPILGPIISGCSVQYGWRWTFRIDLILTGITWLALLFTSETFGPALLKRQAAKLRKDSGSKRYFSRQELNLDSRFTLVENITRPITMLFFEPIITSTAIYIAIAYSLKTCNLLAGVYDFTIEQTSLTYIPIGVGAASSGFVALSYDLIYEKAKKLNKVWTSSPEYHRLPMSCIAGPCLKVSMFWLAWTAKPTVHWAAPVMSGFIFGFGFQTIFISLLTYVTDAYRIYSASALAASVIVRSIAGALFPLAAESLYNSFGVSWATSLLGFKLPVVDRILEPQTIGNFLEFAFGEPLPNGNQPSVERLSIEEASFIQHDQNFSPDSDGELIMTNIMARIGSERDSTCLCMVGKNIQSLKSRLWEGIIPLSNQLWLEKGLNQPEYLDFTCQQLKAVIAVFQYLNEPTVRLYLRDTFNFIYDHGVALDTVFNKRRTGQSGKKPVSVAGLWTMYMTAHFEMMTERAHRWVTVHVNILRAPLLRALLEHRPPGDGGLLGQPDALRWKLADSLHILTEITANADFTIMIPMDGYKGCFTAPPRDGPAALHAVNLLTRSKAYHERLRLLTRAAILRHVTGPWRDLIPSSGGIM